MEEAPIQESVQDSKGKISLVWVTWLKSLASKLTKNELQSLPTYADNATAIAAGLNVGTPYKTATGQVMVVY